MSNNKFNDLYLAASPYSLRPGFIYRLRARSSRSNACGEEMEFSPGPIEPVANRDGAILWKSIRQGDG